MLFIVIPFWKRGHCQPEIRTGPNGDGPLSGRGENRVSLLFANEDTAETWLQENDPEGVAFEYEVLKLTASAHRCL